MSESSPQRGQINAEQFTVLMSPLRPSRVAKRSQGGKQLSYVEAWDIRAHLIRLFGFGNFDIEMIEQNYLGAREYESSGDRPKPMVEPMWMAKMRLVIRDPQGREIGRYIEAAVGTASAPANMLGEAHDNAIKTAASDALKRCAINLGTQFGLSLYDDGRLTDVVRMALVKPDGVEQHDAATKEQAKRLAESVGSVPQEDPSTTEAQETSGEQADAEVAR